MRTLILAIIATLLIIGHSPARQPSVVHINSTMTSHRTQAPDIIDATRTLHAEPLSLINWTVGGGMQLPDSTTPPQPLAEIWLLDDVRPLTVMTFYTARYRDGTRLVTYCFAFIRYTTHWRDASYNPHPQPHGDELPQRHDCQRVMELIELIDKDMRNGW